MKQNQQRYAMQRIDDALKAKLGVLRQKHTKCGKTPTDEEKLKAIVDGDVELRYRPKLEWTLEQAFFFSEMEIRPKLDENAYFKEAEALKERAAKVKDEIMLGDEAKAIKLIREFCGK